MAKRKPKSKPTPVFPDVTFEDWRARVEEELRGAPFERRMVSRTLDGLPIQPLYTERDLPERAPLGVLGLTPLLLGSNPALPRWSIVQAVRASDPVGAGGEIRSAAARAADAVLIRVNGAGRGTPRATLFAGTTLDSAEATSQLAARLGPRRLGLWFDAGTLGRTVAEEVLANLPLRRSIFLHGNWGIDPITPIAARGGGPKETFGELAEIARAMPSLGKRAPRMRLFLVSSRVWSDAGASLVLESALTAAAGIDLLRRLERAGADVTSAAAQLSFELFVDRDLFGEIARLRAFRQVWGRIIGVGGLGLLAAPHLLASSAERSAVLRDPWCGILRGTVANFAAAVGGAQAISVLPFDSAFGLPSPQASRLAVQTHHVLAEEASLAEVIDPAGGSFYLEARTQELANAIWKLVQEIEEQGGLVAAGAAGWIASQLARAAKDRETAFATRREPIIGVSEFANLDEKLPRELDARRLEEKEAAPSMPRRDAEPFERLRDRADRFRSRRRRRPTALLVQSEKIAELRARTEFCVDALRAGGFEVRLSGPTANARQVARAWRARATDVAVLVAPDEEYASFGPMACEALRGCGARGIALAGRPTTGEEALRTAGVGPFLQAGGDLVAALRALLSSAESQS